MRKKIIVLAMILLAGNGILFANSILQEKAVTLVDMLAEHKVLEPTEEFVYRSNRENIIKTISSQRTDIQILPFLYDAVREKKKRLVNYDDHEYDETEEYNKPEQHDKTQEYDKSELLLSLNTIRQTEGLGSLTYHPELDRLAQSYADYLHTNNHFDHLSLDGETLADRIKTVNYSYSFIGENIARGYNSWSDVLDGRYDSPSHKANLLHAGFIHMGLGRAGNYRVQLFGNP